MLPILERRLARTLLALSSVLIGAATPLAPRPASASPPPAVAQVDPSDAGSRPVSSTPRALASAKRIRVLVIPIWFTKGSVGTTDPTRGPGALPTERFVRALQGDAAGTSARRWWKEASFGQVDLSGTVVPWIRVPLKAPSPANGGQGSCGRQEYVDAAVAGAASRGFHQADFDQVVVIASASTCTISGLAGTAKDGATVRTAATFLHATDSNDTLVFLFAHELLHNLGLGHASATECRLGAVRISDAMDPSARCEHREYEDHTSVMGRLDEQSTTAHHPSAVEKAAVGWITEQAGDISAIPVSSLTTAWRRVSLHRSNARGAGPILLRLDHDVARGSTGHTTVELRGRVAPSGSPAHTFEPLTTMWGGSPLPWLRGVSIRSGFDLIDATPQTKTWLDAPLVPGAGTVITSPGGPSDRPWIGAVEIRTQSVIGDTAVVWVRRPPSISQPVEAAQACFRTVDPAPATTTSLDVGCSVFAPQQRISVDWGDGSAPSLFEPPVLTVPVPAHDYPSDAARCFTVTLRIEPTSPSVPVSTATQTIVRGRDGHPACLSSQAVGGALVPPSASPAVASIRAGTHHSCGGTLIASRWVATSVSCYRRAFALAGLSSAPMEVVLGTNSLGPEASTVEHHGLDPGSPVVANQVAGLMLLHLASASSVPPMAIAADAPPVGSVVATLGWGDVQQGFDAWWPRSTHLLRTPLQVRPSTDCPEAGGGAGPGVCAAGLSGSMGIRCAADLGGPIVVAGAPDVLAGVVDGRPGSGPGGFEDGVCGTRTRVVVLAPLVDWIDQHT
jgi:M6 family metalloprotease-like protein